ncbi:acyl-CoA thioesterase [Sphingomonas floccifaciens]|uniref:Acyl-CoA thioesterase n=1 Tax=Sphingomonas floccifaciens TaxID=1844115 RepID=A0ABW4NE48_9SPHN
MPRLPFRPRDAYRHWQPIVTRWSDNDQYGHVNNAIYYQWFDTAVNNWLFGAGLLDVAAGETIGLVVETGCRYAHALSYPQPVEIGLAVEHVGTSSVAYVLGAFASGEAEAAAEARFVHVYVDRVDRRPRPLADAWRAALATIALDPDAAHA